jgi:hypothetical protein
VRVPASFASFTNLSHYEAWTCLAPDSTPRTCAAAPRKVGRHGAWTRDAKPTDANVEQKLIDAGQIRPEEARFNPLDVDSGARVGSTAAP